MKSIKEVLKQRDYLSDKEADEAIENCKEDFYERLARGEYPMDICEEHFGLEPDYLEQIIG